MQKQKVTEILLSIIDELSQNSVDHGDVLCMAENLHTGHRWCSTGFIAEVVAKHLPQTDSKPIIEQKKAFTGIEVLIGVISLMLIASGLRASCDKNLEEGFSYGTYDQMPTLQ